jgi:hypothetical protein
MNLSELFVHCVEKLGKDKGTMRFLLEAKKTNPKVTMAECMAIAGYKSSKEGEDGEKENNNLAQSFRLNILNPVRNYLTEQKFKITKSEIDELWGQSSEETRSEDQQKKRDAILEMLPARSRTTKSKDMSFLSDLI